MGLGGHEDHGVDLGKVTERSGDEFEQNKL